MEENVYELTARRRDGVTVSTAPAAPIALDDQLRYVYENGHVTADVLNGVLLAQGRTPVVARSPFTGKVTGGVIGDELFLYSVTESPVAAEDESAPAQASVPSHSGLAM
jgi:hypothetical protein